MASDSLFAALGAAPNDVLSVFFILYVLASILVYISLIWQINARTSASVDEPKRTFGLPEAILAGALIFVSELITQRLFGSGSSKQNIVELFSGSRTIEQRIMIIVFAVAIAPVVEEFLFRFFLYGVLKRYFGRFLGMIVNALLFAAAHTHLPSFVPLFILGSCFTIAYEWSGSILVSMTMHALFNSLSLTALAFPELFPQ